MAIGRRHELHRRRLGRNAGVAGALALFIAVVFGLSVAKVQRGGELESFDHTYRPSLAEQHEEAE